jgi:perosamine synthetase
LWKIPLFKIYSDEKDIQYVTEVIASGMNWATGPNVGRLEKMIAEYVGREYAVTFNSGTSALHAALLAHGIQKGDEVIVPSFTFIATANSPFFVGAKPVFADIEEKTYGMDPGDLAERITRKTKAIMPVHVGGCSCRIREIREIAEDRGILLIEDAAESLGARIGNEKVGTFGSSAMFSFCAPKVISTGEGGVMVTDDRGVLEKMRLLRSHGRADSKDYFSTNEYLDYVTLGYNFRMSNIIAALGIAQMEKLDRVIEMRQRNAAYLTAGLNCRALGIRTPSAPEGFHHLFQMYTIQADARDALNNHLAEKGIMAKVYFPPVHHSKFYREVLGYRDRLPVTERMAEHVLTLPMYPHLTREEMDYMVDAIAGFSGEGSHG